MDRKLEIFKHHSCKINGSYITARYHYLPIICLKFKRLTVANSHEKMKKCTLVFPVLNHLLELAQTHVHLVRDAIQPSHSLLTPSPAFSLSQSQGLFQ